MYKIIELGTTFPGTSEQRVKLWNKQLLKTASSEIQNVWDKIQANPAKSYLWVIGVSAFEYYGCNNNGDAFHEVELKKAHPSFVNNAHVFLHHVNKDPKQSIGKPCFSWYNDQMHRVELILEIDKNTQKTSDILSKIKNDIPIYVSMGCRVAYDVCSICGNKAPTREQYCDHLKYNMKKILPDGQQVMAFNPSPVFFDVSIVNRPADPTAHTLDKLAGNNNYANYDYVSLPSAVLGEQSLSMTEQYQALDKFADLIKNIEGQIIDKKLPDNFDNIAYPALDYESLHNAEVAPGDLFCCLANLGSPITLGDITYMAGKHIFADQLNAVIMSKIFSLLPKVLSRLQRSPDILSLALGAIQNTAPNQGYTVALQQLIKPVAVQRIQLVQSLGTTPQIQKIASQLIGAFGVPPSEDIPIADSALGLLKRRVSTKGQDFRTITIKDNYGREAQTTPYHLQQSMGVNTLSPWHIPESNLPKILGAALLLGALGATITEPNLLGKALYSTTLGSLGVSLVNRKSDRPTLTIDGKDIPLKVLMETYKQEKTANLRLGTMAGMAIPGALALDYAYNKWRFRNHPGDPAEYMTTPRRLMYRGGEAVTNNPVTSMLAGGVLGSFVSGVKLK